MEKRIMSFKEFYPFYLTQHQDKTCRVLHFVGTTTMFALLLTSMYYLDVRLLIYIPIAGYGFAWIGHFFFEKNKPATFKYPLWSLKADFVMYFELLSGKISIDSSKDKK